ncbi:hypothetical protein [Aliiroseovarius lamellibrachiae]|uniref:hypothetical protein n=1 Tax=Aliiroseovarius lamellibrachiae TaxID=1924933 RepID=UPI001BE11CC6|nr:hypothetical protein [Aliiroseovarius lamellibrachiae]MBT2131655.1 hypothetical protein [Aliiroseovarius lamellibrachiae]
MFLVRSLLFLILSTSFAMSQQLTVKSGEHDKFSRLVVYTQSPGAWTFGRVERGYELRLSQREKTFNISDAFSLIPRTRIKSLEDLGDGRLLIDTDCSCHAATFVASGGQIVIDIISGLPSSESDAFEAFLDVPDAKQIEEARTVMVDSAHGQSTSIARLGLPLLPTAEKPQLILDEAASENSFRDEAQRISDDSAEHGATQNEVELVDSAFAEPNSRDRVRETEIALIEQIGRAAAQGLIDANLSDLEAEVDRVTHPTQEVEAPSPVVAPEFEPIENLDANAHVAVQTSIDRETALQKSETLSTQEGRACLPDEYYAIEAWGGEVQAGADLAKHKSGFLGEFDQPDAEVVTALVRQLVYLTFGAEAKALINRYGNLIDGSDSLTQMSEIMDDLTAVEGHRYSPQMGCDGNTALWAALAQSEFRPGQEINTKAIIVSFSKLPLHLRRHLGPSLAKKFLDAGDMQTAVSLRNILGRVEGDHGPEFQYLEAQIDLEQGETQLAETRLTDIVNDDTSLSPTAALEIVNARLSHNQVVPQRILELVSTFAFEQQGSRLGIDLEIAQIQALANNGDFATAIAEFRSDVADHKYNENEVASLRHAIFSELVDQGTNSDFLRYTVGAEFDYNALGEELRKPIAERLIDLGFARDARVLLDVAGTVPDTEQRLDFAKIALLERKPDVALGYLAGLVTEDAERLRAQAHDMSGDYSLSSEIYSRLGDKPAQYEAAWRGGEWSQLLGGEEGNVPAISQLILATERNAAPSQDGVFMINSGLLTKSEETRNILSGLLKEFPNP